MCAPWKEPSMLEPVRVLTNVRRGLRRAVALECEAWSEAWDEPAPLCATELSPYGAWLETSYPLELGDWLVLSVRLRPKAKELFVEGRVRRVELRRRITDKRRAGMGVEFVDLAPTLRLVLDDVLRGTPPPLPERAPGRTEQVWIEEVSEPQLEGVEPEPAEFSPVEDRELVTLPVAPLPMAAATAAIPVAVPDAVLCASCASMPPPLPARRAPSRRGISSRRLSRAGTRWYG
jgi:hypothetical protein